MLSEGEKRVTLMNALVHVSPEFISALDLRKVKSSQRRYNNIGEICINNLKMSWQNIQKDPIL